MKGGDVIEGTQKLAYTNFRNCRDIYPDRLSIKAGCFLSVTNLVGAADYRRSNRCKYSDLSYLETQKLVIRRLT